MGRGAGADMHVKRSPELPAPAFRPFGRSKANSTRRQPQDQLVDGDKERLPLLRKTAAKPA